MNNESVLVHFSGGSDSTLTAALCVEQFNKVYLITYNRASFIGIKDAKENFNKLCEVYGEDKFHRIENYPIGEWYKKLIYRDYFKTAIKYGTAVTCPCGPCKLSFHWHSIIYCINHGIKTVADGTVPYMDLYPDQNRKIIGENLQDFYEEFGINYLNPVYGIAEEVEQRLYDKGIFDAPLVRGSKKDKQVYCAEQVLFAFFVKYFHRKHGKEKYEKTLRYLYKEKMEYMKETVLEYIERKEDSFVFTLMGHEK